MNTAGALPVAKSTRRPLPAPGRLSTATRGLTRQIRLRRQKEGRAIFTGIIHKNETYDATLCNPPFHDSAASARAGGERKRRNLGLGKIAY